VAAQNAILASDLLVEQPRILCVDDSEDILQLLTDVLECAGYDVVTSSDPNEALGVCLSGDFDLIVVDNDMPGLSGLELARMVKREMPYVPVLMFSGGVLTEADKLDVAAVVPKGAGADRLLSAIGEGLSG